MSFVAAVVSSIDYSDVCLLQTLFVQRLREEESSSAASSADEPAQIGLLQKDLLSWYFDKMVERYGTIAACVQCQNAYTSLEVHVLLTCTFDT